MPAFPYNDTAVVDQPWDGPGAEAKLKNPVSLATAGKVYAWHANSDDPAAKADLKFPHHEVSSDGTPGAANVAGVRAALSRVNQAATQIPDGDKAAVRAHLQKHLDKFNSGNKPKSALVDELDSGMVILDAAALAGRVWAVTEDLALAMQTGLKVLGQLGPDAIEQALEVQAAMAAKPPVVHGNGVAVVPLTGVITPKPSLLSLLFGGGGGLVGFRRQLDAAVANPDVSHIVLNVDSPGGAVDLVPETAHAIRRAGQAKPIVAQANTLMASAAYWLASQAHEIAVTPSGVVGSVGVYKLHQDLSGAHEMRGIRPTLISAGDHKVDGNPFEPISGDALDKAKQDVNDYYSMFVDDVARGRRVDNPGYDGDAFGGGNTLIGKRAVRNGLADRVSTLEETLKRLSSGRARVKNTPSAEDFDEDEDVLDDADEEDQDDDTEVVVSYSAEDKRRIFDLMAGGGFGTDNSDKEVANA
jgi:signal peptide peptidase SppA